MFTKDLKYLNVRNESLVFISPERVTGLFLRFWDSIEIHPPLERGGEPSQERSAHQHHSRDALMIPSGGHKRNQENV